MSMPGVSGVDDWWYDRGVGREVDAGRDERVGDGVADDVELRPARRRDRA